ncbi:MAG: thermonuclease family protein [Candidatus Methylomirabilales bacterium]
MAGSHCSKRRRLVPICGLVLLLLSPGLGAGSSKVERVIDGDTVILEDGRRVRYVGINTPERDQPHFAEAVALNRRLTEGKHVRLEGDEVREDGYHRLLAYVYVDGHMVNARLIEEGLAHVFAFPPNLRYYDRFLELQRRARVARRGIWQSVRGPLKITSLKFNAPGDDRFNPNGEYVRIASVADRVIDVRGYVLRDAYGHRYTFPALSLKPGYSVLLVSGRGVDVADPGRIILYWQSDGAIWNNDGDTATLLAPDGSTVDRFQYQGFKKRRPTTDDRRP